MPYVVTYFKSQDQEALTRFVLDFTNRIGPGQGRAAIPESTDEEGNVMPEVPAAGDPTFWYASIIARRDMSFLADGEVIQECTQEEAAPVIGVWA